MAPARRPIRWWLAVPVLILLGACVNVLVAWGFIMWTPPPANTAIPRRADLVIVRSRDEARPFLTSELLRLLDGHSDEELAGRPVLMTFQQYAKTGVRAERAFYLGRQVTIAHAGFPLPSLSYTRTQFLRAPAAPSTVANGLSIPGLKPSWPAPMGPGAQPFPLRPQPRPFTLNTLMYAVVLAGCWLALRRMSRAGIAEHRRALGRCTQCGYDLAGVVVPECPECGQPRELSATLLTGRGSVSPVECPPS